MTKRRNNEHEATDASTDENVDVQENLDGQENADGKPQDGEQAPESLTGSGTKFIKVIANARVLGLVPGETQNIVDTDEVRANIEAGNLILVEGD